MYCHLNTWVNVGPSNRRVKFQIPTKVLEIWEKNMENVISCGCVLFINM